MPGSSPRKLVAVITLLIGGTLPVFLTGSLALELRADFPFDDVLLGVAIAVFWGVAAAGAALGGLVADRIGDLRALRLAAGGGAACSLGIALFVDSAPTLLGFLALGGLASALAQPGVTGLVSRNFDERRHGVALGLQQAGPPTGVLLAGIALPLVALPFGWRWAYGAAALVAVAATLVVRREDFAPRDRASELPDPDQLPRMRPILALALGGALATAAGGAVLTFLVVFAVDTGLSGAQAGLLLALNSVAAVAARVGLGLLADRRRRRVLLQVAAMLALGAAGFGLLATRNPAAVVAGAFVTGAIGWGWTGLFHLAVVGEYRHAPGAAVGLGLTGLFAGGVLGPPVFGLIVERTSFEVGWIVCAATMIVASGVLLLGRRAVVAARVPAASGR